MSHGTYKTLTLKLFDKRETQDACQTDLHASVSWNESWHRQIYMHLSTFICAMTHSMTPSYIHLHISVYAHISVYMHLSDTHPVSHVCERDLEF